MKDRKLSGRMAQFLVMLSVLFSICFYATLSEAVTLAWDENALEENVTHYTIYIRYAEEQEYYESRDVGLDTTYDWTGLALGQQYAFAVTAENSKGESGFSAEVFYTPTGGLVLPSFLSLLRQPIEWDTQQMTDISDDFNRSDSDSLGANWTELYGDVDIASNQVEFLSGSFAWNLAIHNTSVGGADQYIKIKLTATGLNITSSVVLRYTDPDSPIYYITFDGYDEEVLWRSAAVEWGIVTIGGPSSLTVDDDDEFGITIEGTGSSTIIRIWRNPTADTPQAADEWDSGDTTPDLTFTDNPGANAVDSGNYVGILAQFGSGTTPKIDDFFAGNIAAAGATEVQSGPIFLGQNYGQNLGTQTK